MRLSYFFSVLFFLSILFLAIIFMVNKDKFLVSKVEIRADFHLNRKVLMNKLEIEDGWYIWQYRNTKIAAFLDELYFIDDYTITKKYPSKIEIKLLKRKPIARTSGKDGEIFFIDRRGVIFKSSRIKESIPLFLIENRDQITVGKRIGGKYSDTIHLLSTLSAKYQKLYTEIAQLSVYPHSPQMITQIDFRTINKTISLKKKLNVENLLEALIVSKICGELYEEHILLNDIENGYCYSYQ